MQTLLGSRLLLYRSNRVMEDMVRMMKCPIKDIECDGDQLVFIYYCYIFSKKHKVYFTPFLR